MLVKNYPSPSSLCDHPSSRFLRLDYNELATPLTLCERQARGWLEQLAMPSFSKR